MIFALNGIFKDAHREDRVSACAQGVNHRWLGPQRFFFFFNGGIRGITWNNLYDRDMIGIGIWWNMIGISKFRYHYYMTNRAVYMCISVPCYLAQVCITKISAIDSDREIYVQSIIKWGLYRKAGWDPPWIEISDRDHQQITERACQGKEITTWGCKCFIDRCN